MKTISEIYDIEEETFLKCKNHSKKNCICGGHNVKKNKNHYSTKKKLEIRKKRLFKQKQHQIIEKDL